MREITIARKDLVATLIRAAVFLDGNAVASVKNGETVTVQIDDNAHVIYAADNGPGNTLRICEGSQNIFLNLEFAVNSFYLYTGENIDNYLSIEEITDDIQPPADAPIKSQVPSYICGIIITLLLTALSSFIFGIGETSVLGLIIGIVFSIASGVFMIMGGFWFVIIPLPVIYLFKAGCAKPDQSTKRKVVFGVLSGVLPFLSFAVLFLLRNV